MIYTSAWQTSCNSVWGKKNSESMPWSLLWPLKYYRNVDITLLPSTGPSRSLLRDGLEWFFSTVRLQATLPPCYILFSITQAMHIILHEYTAPNYDSLQTLVQKSEHDPVPDRENCISFYIVYTTHFQISGQLQQSRQSLMKQYHVTEKTWKIFHCARKFSQTQKVQI